MTKILNVLGYAFAILITIGCASTSHNCPPGKKWMSKEDIIFTINVVGVTAAYQTEKARACHNKQLEDAYQRITDELRIMRDNAEKDLRTFDGDRFMDLSYQVADLDDWYEQSCNSDVEDV